MSGSNGNSHAPDRISALQYRAAAGLVEAYASDPHRLGGYYHSILQIAVKKYVTDPLLSKQAFQDGWAAPEEMPSDHIAPSPPEGAQKSPTNLAASLSYKVVHKLINSLSADERQKWQDASDDPTDKLLYMLRDKDISQLVVKILHAWQEDAANGRAEYRPINEIVKKREVAKIFAKKQKENFLNKFNTHKKSKHPGYFDASKNYLQHHAWATFFDVGAGFLEVYGKAKCNDPSQNTIFNSILSSDTFENAIGAIAGSQMVEDYFLSEDAIMKIIKGSPDTTETLSKPEELLAKISIAISKQYIKSLGSAEAAKMGLGSDLKENIRVLTQNPRFNELVVHVMHSLAEDHRQLATNPNHNMRSAIRIVTEYAAQEALNTAPNAINRAKRSIQIQLATLSAPLHREIATASSDAERKALMRAIDAGEFSGRINAKSRLFGGKRPLEMAIKRQDFDLAATLIDAGAEAGEKAFRVAIKYKSSDMLQGIIARSGDAYKAWINKPDKHGKTPLARAILNRDAACVKVLLASGADINAYMVSKSQTRLRSKDYQKPLLLEALQSGNEEIIDLLLSSDELDMNLTDSRGMHPVAAAALKSNPKVLKKVLTKYMQDGDNLTRKITKEGQTLLPLLLSQNRHDMMPELVKRFSEHPDNITRPITPDGQTLFHLLMLNGETDLMEPLYRGAVEIGIHNDFAKIPDDTGLTPLDLLRSKDGQEQNRILLALEGYYMDACAELAVDEMKEALLEDLPEIFKSIPGYVFGALKDGWNSTAVTAYAALDVAKAAGVEAAGYITTQVQDGLERTGELLDAAGGYIAIGATQAAYQGGMRAHDIYSAGTTLGSYLYTGTQRVLNAAIEASIDFDDAMRGASSTDDALEDSLEQAPIQANGYLSISGVVTDESSDLSEEAEEEVFHDCEENFEATLSAPRESAITEDIFFTPNEEPEPVHAQEADYSSGHESGYETDDVQAPILHQKLKSEEKADKSLPEAPEQSSVHKPDRPL